MRGVALYRSDEVRNQVVAALQLDIDILPRFINLVLERNKTVISRDEPGSNNGDNDQEYQQIHRKMSIVKRNYLPFWA